MILAVLSDIHGNLEAFEKILELLRDDPVDAIYCLGDIVGYGPNPNECVELVRKHCTATLMGNHDYAAIGLANIAYFNEYAKFSTYWTREKLTQDNLDYLKSLPFTFEQPEFFLVHAAPQNPSNWNYVLSVSDAQKQFSFFNQDICFVGHSHVPIIFSRNKMINTRNYILNNQEQYVVNVGSVGQPRDGDPRACLVIYNTETREIRYVRLDYEIQKTYNKIIRAGLPVFLAERLLKGY